MAFERTESIKALRSYIKSMCVFWSILTNKKNLYYTLNIAIWISIIVKVVFGFVFYITSETEARILLRLNPIIHTKWKTYITHGKVFCSYWFNRNEHKSCVQQRAFIKSMCVCKECTKNEKDIEKGNKHQESEREKTRERETRWIKNGSNGTKRFFSVFEDFSLRLTVS